METRGKMWFVAQFALFVAILVALLFRHAGFPLWLRAVGAIALLCGGIIAVRGYQTLGGSHSPWTNPIEGGQLVSSGIYSYVRHPIYSGLIVGTFGLALVAKSVAGIGVALKPKIFAYVVSAWLLLIVANLLMIPGYFDVALRDFGLALAAFALARLSQEFDR